MRPILGALTATDKAPLGVPPTSLDESPIVGPSESLARANPADHNLHEKRKRGADQRFERVCSLYEMFSRKDPYEDMTMNQVYTPLLRQYEQLSVPHTHSSLQSCKW
jgi:hypothetical protein